jgi:hypothetical protein
MCYNCVCFYVKVKSASLKMSRSLYGEPKTAELLVKLRRGEMRSPGRNSGAANAAALWEGEMRGAQTGFWLTEIS